MTTTRTDLRSSASRRPTGDSRTCEQPASDPDVPARGQNIREIALELRLLLHWGISFALATVVGAQVVGPAQGGHRGGRQRVRESIGVNRSGGLDRAIQELAAQVLSTGADRLERYEIDEDPASYIGLSGKVSLDVHVMRLTAGDSGFDDVLRYLDSPVAAVGCRRSGADRQARTRHARQGRGLLPPVRRCRNGFTDHLQAAGGGQGAYLRPAG